MRDCLQQLPQDTNSMETEQIIGYLSGPMTGIAEFNAPEFAKYAKKYREKGYKILSPPELDLGDTSKNYEYYIRRDVRVLLQDGVNRVYLLKGWQKSKGANLEVHLAKMFNIPIYDAESGEPYTETILAEAERLVGGDRRETYNSPMVDFGRTAKMLTGMLHHKINSPFTEEEIALIMICVKLSRLTNKPDHRDSLVDVAGYARCYEMIREERERGNNDKV